MPSAQDGDDELPAQDLEVAPSSETELNERKIQQVSALRRSTYRTRSYCLIGAAACAVGAVQLILMVIREVLANGWGPWPVCYILLAICAAWGAVHWAMRAIDLNREARISSLDQPTASPDFSGLGDGSGVHERLDQIR